jgi:hypothetical protein
MSKSVMRLGTALVAASVACVGAALAQAHRPGGAPAAVPHVSAPAPHFSAPAPPINAAPHIVAAPHFNAAPRVSAAPRIGAPHASVRTFAPRGRAVTPQFAARSNLVGRNVARQTFTRSTAHNTIGRNLSRGRGAVARSTGRSATGARALARTNGRPGTNNRLGNAKRLGTGTRQDTANGRTRLSGAQLATLSRPLGARNRNFRDRDRFFADRRRFHRGGFIGWFGPVFWPYAYDDFYDYAFWPREYDDYAFWPSAYDDLFASVFWNPGTEDIYASVGAPEGRRGRGARAAASVDQVYRTATASCRAGDPGLAQWPVEEIAQVVRPTSDQQKLLDDLKAASAQAVKLLQTACPATQPSTPPGRLDAIAARLNVMMQALDTVRPALATFYDSLNDEQKARFNAIGQQQGATAANGATAKSEARVCSDQPPGGLTAEGIDRIKLEVRPNNRQGADLDALRDAATKAVEELRAACPSQTPITPVARLDAMSKHLHAMLDAVNTMRPALAKFYDSLSDEQKAHFNIMGPQQG